MPGQNQLLQSLSPAVFSTLQPHLRSRELPSGDVLFVAGEKVNNIYFPQSGAISLVTELSGGQMIESGMVGRDGVVGGGAALDHRIAVCKAIAQVSGNGHLLDVDIARRIARDSEEFRTALVRHEQLLLVQAQQSAACNATHNLQERLARWLLRVRDVTGSDSFNLTQEFMAEMLGVRRTSVSIIAHALQQTDMIHYRRGHITITNLDALRRSACECYAVVKEQYDRVLPAQAPARALTEDRS